MLENKYIESQNIFKKMNNWIKEMFMIILHEEVNEKS